MMREATTPAADHAPLSVDALFNAAFDPRRCRTPRSPEYKAGVRAALAYRISGTPINSPYEDGTAQADAFYSGLEEGHALWRRAQEGAPADA